MGSATLCHFSLCLTVAGTLISLQQVKGGTWDVLVFFSSCFISRITYPFLVLHQDHPEHGVLSLVRELLGVIQDYTWEDNSDDKVRIYTCVLHLLSAMSQETYLYHVDKGRGPRPGRAGPEFHESQVEGCHFSLVKPLVFYLP